MRARLAWIIASSLAACGGHGEHTSPDGSGPPGTASVTVFRDDAVAAAIQVVFIDTAQTQVVTTDATGVASATVQPDASVTVILPPETTPHVEPLDFVTVLSVQPGDQIVLGPGADESQVAVYSVSLEDLGLPAGDDYDVDTQCGVTLGLTSPISVPIDANCKSDPVAFVAEAGNASGPLYAFASVPFTPNGTVAMPDFTAEPTFTFSYADAEPGAQLSAARMSTGSSNNAGQQVASDGTASLQFSGAVGASATVLTAVTDLTHSGSFQHILDAVPAGQLAYSLDVDTTLLPWIGTPTYEAATRTLMTPVDASGTSGDSVDMFDASVIWMTTTDPAIAEWEVFGPAPGDITLPTLPSDVPYAGPSTQILQTLAEAVDNADVSGYEVAHLHPLSLDTNSPVHRERVSSSQLN